jgi:hypothetical protein
LLLWRAIYFLHIPTPPSYLRAFFFFFFSPSINLLLLFYQCGISSTAAKKCTKELTAIHTLYILFFFNTKENERRSETASLNAVG